MKFLSIILIGMGLLLNLSFDFLPKYYQVISAHPHELEEIAPYIETVKKDGRLWIVKLKKKSPQDLLKHLRPLTGKEKTYMYLPAIFAKRMQMKTPTKISVMLDLINRNNIQEDVEKLASFESRAAGTAGNQEAVLSVEQRLSSFGYEINKICHSADVCSIVADKKGTVFPDQVLMVVAHLDSVGEKFAGADDNATGTAVLLEMARVFMAYKNKKSIRFFVTNAEENGMLGAAHYARYLAKQGKLKQIEFLTNMDMVGYNSDGIVELETNPEFEAQAKWLADIASRFTNLKTKITLGAWGSDHVPFLRRGINSHLIIENWDTKNPCYHLSCDIPESVNYEYAVEIGKLNMAAILNKDLI